MNIQKYTHLNPNLLNKQCLSAYDTRMQHEPENKRRDQCKNHSFDYYDQRGSTVSHPPLVSAQVCLLLGHPNANRWAVYLPYEFYKSVLSNYNIRKTCLTNSYQLGIS